MLLRSRTSTAGLAGAVLAVALVAAGCGGGGASSLAPPAASDATGTSTAGTSSAGTSTAGTSSAGTSTAGTSSAGTSSAGTSSGPVAAPGPCGIRTKPKRVRHVVWIWMENHQWSQVIGSPTDAPAEAELAHACGTATNYSSVGSPSLPNYIAATSGDTQSIVDDNPPASHPLSVDNLFRQVRAAGGSERSYEESMPSDCALASTSLYVTKHNPAAYYLGGSDRQACGSDDLPLQSFYADLNAERLATFSFITPNLCNDTHDCSVSAGDQWLATLMPRLLDTPEYRSGTTAVFVIWDETSPMPNLIISPSTRPATTGTQPYDHYSLLRTTEQLLGLPLLGRAAHAPSMVGQFNL